MKIAPSDQTLLAVSRQKTDPDGSTVTPSVYDFFLPDNAERVLIVENASHLAVSSKRRKPTHFCRLNIDELVENHINRSASHGKNIDIDASIVDLRFMSTDDFSPHFLNLGRALLALKNLHDSIPDGSLIIGLGINRYGELLHLMRQFFDHSAVGGEFRFRPGLGGIQSYRRLFQKAGFSSVRIYLVLPEFAAANKVLTATLSSARSYFREEYRKTKQRKLSWLIRRVSSEFGINLIVERHIIITARK